ncbi:MAG: hypothetical protein ACD_58C00239G0007 [uncultured bacterium]|nr:MAG: hypothetical protein ACD_58C00239G0007 [uncultured bacterium]
MKQIISKPIISEKSMGLTPEGKYVFITEKGVNKPQIAQKINEIYKVRVKSVNIINVQGKTKRYKGRFSGKTSNWKKAIVTLEKGQKISDFEIKK